MKYALIIGMFALLLLSACTEQYDPTYEQYCTSGIGEIQGCNGYIKAIYGNLGGGVRWYDATTGDYMDCPVVGPDSTTPACKTLMERQESGMGCEKVYECENNAPRACCKALTAECLSCSEGVSVEEYCKENPTTAGCKTADDSVICTEPRPEICTQQYDPVCAEKDTGIRCITTPCPSTDNVTYGNGCSACTDPEVYSYTPGECPGTLLENGKEYAICDNLPTGFEQLREEYNCVDECPAGLDSYGTDIGLVKCIKPLGKEEFMTWQPCKRSVDCEETCAYATITTDGREVEWDEADDANGYPADSLRCITKEYSNFLIHRGLTSVDEKGKVSVAIA